MFITASKPVLPGIPFGLSDGTVSLAVGQSVRALSDFIHAGVRIPKGTIASVIKKNDRFICYELDLPREPDNKKV